MRDKVAYKKYVQQLRVKRFMLGHSGFYLFSCLSQTYKHDFISLAYFFTMLAYDTFTRKDYLSHMIKLEKYKEIAREGVPQKTLQITREMKEEAEKYFTKYFSNRTDFFVGTIPTHLQWIFNIKEKGIMRKEV